MSFCTVINCMDGRVQLPVIRYLMDRFNVACVDSVTEPGPLRHLADEQEGAKVASMLERGSRRGRRVHEGPDGKPVRTTIVATSEPSGARCTARRAPP